MHYPNRHALFQYGTPYPNYGTAYPNKACLIVARQGVSYNICRYTRFIPRTLKISSGCALMASESLALGGTAYGRYRTPQGKNTGIFRFLLYGSMRPDNNKSRHWSTVQCIGACLSEVICTGQEALSNRIRTIRYRRQG